MIKELKKLSLCFFICIFFCLSCKTEVTKYIQSESEHTSIVWKGSFASADEIENPQYLWAYYNTTDGCSYIYDGEKWTLLTSAGKNGADGLDGQNGTDGTNGTDGSDGTNGKNARVVILYALNGGILPESAPSIYSYGTPVELEEPVFEPYTFEGFYYNADFSGKKVTSLDDDYAYGKVLYARWGYKITFDDNYTGGELNTLEYYDIDSVNNSFKTPERTGYTFLGWYNNPNYDEQIDCWNTNENKGNVTFYAKWKINEYTISYYNIFGASPAPVKVEYGTVLDETYFPVLSDTEDSHFIGWRDRGGVSVGVGTQYVVTSDTIFYADCVFKKAFIFPNCHFYEDGNFSGDVRPLGDMKDFIMKYGLADVYLYLDDLDFGRGYAYYDAPDMILYDHDKVINFWRNGYFPIGVVDGLFDYWGTYYFEYFYSYTIHQYHYDFFDTYCPDANNCLPPNTFESGNYKCYAIASLQGHKYLVPISDSKNLIVIDDESDLDPDSIPEGYYYDVTIP
ncbi:MAG: InlB B-repeat-containing protein [Treponema sp.]|nr:InlB B-repeat-containing protein [Treponema sp.]